MLFKLHAYSILTISLPRAATKINGQFMLRFRDTFISEGRPVPLEIKSKSANDRPVEDKMAPIIKHVPVKLD